MLKHLYFRFFLEKLNSKQTIFESLFLNLLGSYLYTIITIRYKTTGMYLRSAYLTSMFASCCSFHGECYEVSGFSLKFMESC